MKLKQFALHPARGVPEGIGFSLAAMEEVREQLLEAVSELSEEQIARRAFQGAHSIGALVLHIGEAEWWWTNCIIKGRRLSIEDCQQPFWDVLKKPEEFASKKYSSAFCLDTIAAIREETREFLATLDDNDLEKVYSHERGHTTMEASLRWILHHLVDHEAQHKGQILMLKRLLGAKTEDFI